MNENHNNVTWILPICFKYTDVSGKKQNPNANNVKMANEYVTLSRSFTKYATNIPIALPKKYAKGNIVLSTPRMLWEKERETHF